MFVCGVISEFNPFHNGHRYMLEKARKITNADFVVVIMSGSFVQRGEPALISKLARTEQALKCGADLVIELPFDYATSSAQGFARGAVDILDKSGVVDAIAFGSECGDIDMLTEITQGLSSDDFDTLIVDELKSGVSYPSARQNVLSKKIGTLADILKSSNNLLGIEYMLAIKHFKSNIKPFTVKRSGVEHDSLEMSGNSVSALNLRTLIGAGENVRKFMPENAYVILNEEIANSRGPVYLSDMEKSIISHLRKMTPSDFKLLRDVSEGLEFSLSKVCAQNNTLEDIISAVKSKRYTYSRIKRIILHAFLGLGVEKESIPEPEYVRILGMKKRASELVREMRKKSKLPVIQNLSSEKEIPDMLKREISATDIWGTFAPKTISMGEDYRKFPLIIE